jgi:hypothetical protein
MSDLFDNADYFGSANSLLGGISKFMSGQASASGSKQAAAYYGQAAQYSQVETAIKQQQADRQIYQVIGGAKAAAGASGLANSGGVADIIRDSATQGALSKRLIETQGDINYTSYKSQQASASAAASSSSTGGLLGAVTGVVSGIASLFSDDKLKTDIELVRRRADGLGIYRFRFGGQGPLFEGVLASEVEALYPDAVQRDEFGTRKIFYDKIGVEFREIS